MYSFTRTWLLHLAWISLLLGGCQSKVYLMPAPVSLGSDAEFFELSEETRDENLLYTLYASNRLPYSKGKNTRGYTVFPTDALEMGLTVHRVGEPGMSWEDLYRESISDNRDEDLIIYEVHARKKVRYEAEEDLTQLTPTAEGFFQKINQQIERSLDKDITIYVHGANSNFYRATAQGAQLFHFTGHNSIVLTFSWPSAGSLLRYHTDVLHASQTVYAFARLVEVLATHTRARNINILAYSAGAQIAIPGLSRLREMYPEKSAAELKQRWRIGEVYLAAPDSDFPAFADHFFKFREIVNRTTLNVNNYDTVLKFAASQSRYSRLGKPNLNELDEEQLQAMREATRTAELDILDVGDSEALELGGAHGSWYTHPWVSNDLLLLYLFNVPPEERGLVALTGEKGGKIYRFPPDYDQRIRELISQNREQGLLMKQEQKPHGE